MTRLSHVPFAKSFLAISLSAVFSCAVYAGVEQIPTNEDFIVTVNGIEQEENYSSDTNPAGNDSTHWWGPSTSLQDNVVQLTVKPSVDGSVTNVIQDVFGGWSSTGTVQNNQLLIDGSETNQLLLGGFVYGSFSNQVNKSIVTNNEVIINSASLGAGSALLDSVVTAGESIYLPYQSEDLSGLSSSVSNNRLILTDITVKKGGTRLIGGQVREFGGDVVNVNNNSVIVTNLIITDEDGSGLDIYGGNIRVRSIVPQFANVSGNYVELSNLSSVSPIAEIKVFGGKANGLETYADNNIVRIYDSNATSVVVAEANSHSGLSDLPVGAAQANGNQLIWHNQDDIRFTLDSLSVAKAESTSKVNVSNNYGEIVGIKSKITKNRLGTFDPEESGSQVMGFWADGGVTGLVSNTDNILKVHESYLHSLMGAVALGDQTFMTGNRIELTGTQNEATEIVNSVVAFGTKSNKSSLSDNILVTNYAKISDLYAIRVNATETDVQNNNISITNSDLGVFNGIEIAATKSVDVRDNHIVLDRVNFSNNGYSTFVSINASGTINVQDNVLEIYDGQGMNIQGMEVYSIENGSQIDVKNNTLLIKDTVVDQAIIGILISGNLTDTQLNLQNNTLILDNVSTSGVMLTYVDSQRSFRGASSAADHQQGRIVLRGHNRVNQTFAGFDSLQFDLNTAEAGKAMLELRESLALDGQTLVINTAGLSSVSEDLNLIESTGGAVTMNNVTLQTAGTFETKSMVVSNNEGLDSFSLGLYYDELMAQESVLSDSTLTLSDSQLATIALTRQSSEEALSLLQSSDNLSVDAPVKGFATLSGSSNFYELGTGFDLNGTSLTVGGALRINDNWSGVAFAQYSDANADSTVSGFRGDSDMKTYSAGVALRYQTEMPFYTEGAVVFGQADTDFVGSYTNDTARYNSDRFYTTAQLGIGSDVKLSDAVNLNVYGRYSFTYLDGDKVALNNATRDTFDVDDTMVHAMRVGAQVKGCVAPNVQWFAGAAFERVLDGDVKSMVNDAKLKTETLKGNVGIFEVGATLAPNDLGPWTMDVKAGAYAGDRRGVSGSVSVNYVF